MSSKDVPQGFQAMSRPEVRAVVEELHVHVKIYAQVYFPKYCHLPTLFPSDLSAWGGGCSIEYILTRWLCIA